MSKQARTSERRGTIEIDYALDRVPMILLGNSGPMEAIKNGLDQAALDNPKARDADPNQFFDAKWVQELDQSGFIAGLYK